MDYKCFLKCSSGRYLCLPLVGLYNTPTCSPSPSSTPILRGQLKALRKHNVFHYRGRGECYSSSFHPFFHPSISEWCEVLYPSERLGKFWKTDDVLMGRETAGISFPVISVISEVYLPWHTHTHAWIGPTHMLRHLRVHTHTSDRHSLILSISFLLPLFSLAYFLFASVGYNY